MMLSNPALIGRGGGGSGSCVDLGGFSEVPPVSAVSTPQGPSPPMAREPCNMFGGGGTQVGGGRSGKKKVASLFGLGANQPIFFLGMVFSSSVCFGLLRQGPLDAMPESEGGGRWKGPTQLQKLQRTPIGKLAASYHLSF